MNAEIQNAVFDLIQNERQCQRNEIALDRSLNYDLGMDGDDAVEFFEEFGKKFNVDLTELGHEWNLYFVPEGVSLFGPPDGYLTLFTARPLPSKGRKLPITIDRVVRAAEDGHWEKLQNNIEA